MLTSRTGSMQAGQKTLAPSQTRGPATAVSPWAAARQRVLLRQRPARAPAAVPAPRSGDTVDAAKLAELFAAQPMEQEDRGKLERLMNVLGVTLGEAKSLGFRKRALLELDESELQSRLELVASTVGVPVDQAKRMAAIQPNLLLDAKRNADALALGLRAICYELGCPKEEAVELILTNKSILHGREMHLSVADIAHLAMLRQPVGRIVD